MSEAATITPRREKTRQKLMGAAESVIAERGILAASVEEICDRAGFTRGAFYSNFSSKEDLALALLRGSAESHLAAAGGAIDEALNGTPSNDSVEGMVLRAVDIFVATQPSERDALLLQAELRLHAVRNEEFGRAYAAFDEEMTTLFAQTIAATLESRGLRLAISAEQAVDLLHAVHEAASMDALMGGRRPGGLADNLKTLLLALLRRD